VVGIKMATRRTRGCWLNMSGTEWGLVVGCLNMVLHSAVPQDSKYFDLPNDC